MPSIRYCLVSLAVLISPLLCSAQKEEYVLFHVPGDSSTVPFSINDYGAVTGYYYSPTVHLGGFIREPDGKFTTFQFPGAALTEPRSINRHGTVTGYWEAFDYEGPPWQGFVRDRWGSFSSIDVPGSTSVWPVQINDNGTVVGYYSTASDYGLPYFGFVRHRDGTITTYNEPGALYTLFTGVNNAGEIIGTSSDDFFKLSPDGVLTSIPDGEPLSVNDKGEIAGTYSGSQDYLRSRHGDITLFNIPGVPNTGGEYLSINDHGTVMGSYGDQLTVPSAHGFLRSREGVITSFDPPKSSDTIPTDINNANVVTGFFYVGTSTRSSGFLRIPKCDHDGDSQP